MGTWADAGEGAGAGAGHLTISAPPCPQIASWSIRALQSASVRRCPAMTGRENADYVLCSNQI